MNCFIENKYFRHTDTNLITSLLTLGFKLASLDKQDPQRVVFSIQREEGLDKAIESYWSDTMRISPLQFANNIKLLKTRIYQG